MNLWEPKRCCCCNVRTGSIVIAILLLVGGCFTLFGVIRNLIVGYEEANEKFCNTEPTFDNCLELMNKLELGSSITSLVISIFYILFSSLLLHGILKQKTAYFIPLMIAYSIHIGLLILIGVAMIILLLAVGIDISFVLFATVFFGLYIFLETYFLLCIRAHYLQIKRNKGQLHSSLKDTDIEVSPCPGNQIPPYPGAQVPPPYPGAPGPQYPGTQHIPLYPGDQVPPYPSNEVPPYPGSDPLLHPSQKN